MSADNYWNWGEPKPAADAPKGVPMDPEIFGDLPTPDKEMFPVEVALRPVFRNRSDDVANVLGMTHEQRVTRHRTFVEAIRESGLEPNTVGERFYNLITDFELRDKRGTLGDVAAQERAWAEESRRDIRNRYGDRGETLLQHAQQFVAAHPKLRGLLTQRGLASHPQIVAALVEHVRTNNIGGKAAR